MKSLILSICLFLSFTTIAQDYTALPKINIKYNFTSILDISSPYIALSVEYPIAKRISLEHELGYVNNRFELFNPRQYAGIRSRNQLHLFFPENFEYMNHSIDIHLVGKHVVFPTGDYDFSRFEGAFQQKYRVSPRYSDVGMLIGYRTVFYLPDANLSFEIGSAIGLKRPFTTLYGDDIPEDAQVSNQFAFNLNFSPPLDINETSFVIALINFKMGLFF
jgi:hypothetical protein